MIRRPPRSTLFPYTRSSDLLATAVWGTTAGIPPNSTRARQTGDNVGIQDRKSTRLNSSHGYISYAVFCLKKKKTHARNSTGRVACPQHQSRKQRTDARQYRL